jgi:hypothetical protein
LHYYFPNDLLTAGWNQTPRRNRVNTRVHTCTLPPTCSHLCPGPTRRRPARAHGPLVRGDCSNIGSRTRSVPIPSPPVSSLGFPLPLYIPVIWGRFPASPSPPRIPAANSDRTRTEVSSRHHHGVACYVTEHMHGDFFLFVCFDRSASTGGRGRRKPRGGVSGSRRRR